MGQKVKYTFHSNLIQFDAFGHYYYHLPTGRTLSQLSEFPEMGPFLAAAKR